MESEKSPLLSVEEGINNYDDDELIPEEVVKETERSIIFQATRSMDEQAPQLPPNPNLSSNKLGPGPSNSGSFNTKARKERWKGKRWRVLSLVTLFAFLSPLTNSTYLPALKEIQDTFKASDTDMTWTMGSYSLGISVLSLLWGPLSDRVSRKYVMLGTIVLYVGASILCSFAQNIWYLIIGRGLQAAGLSSLAVIGSACISDVFPFGELGKAMGIFGAAPGIMPVVGPILGGFLVHQFGWKILFDGIAGLGGIACIVIFFLLPETLDKSSTTKRSFNIFKPIRLLFVPSIGIVILGTSFNYGGSSLMTFQFTLDAKALHNLNSLQIGLCLAPYGLGTILGNLISGKISDVLRKSTLGSKGYLVLVSIGLIGYAIGVFSFGFFIKKNFYVSVFFTFLVGFFITFTYPSALCFAIEKQPANPSAVATSFQLSYLPATMILFALRQTILDKFGVTESFIGASILILVLSIPIQVYLIILFSQSNKKSSIQSTDSTDSTR